MHAHCIHLMSIGVSLHGICRCYGYMYHDWTCQLVGVGCKTGHTSQQQQIRCSGLQVEAQGIANSRRRQQHASGKQQQDHVQGKKHEEEQQQQVGSSMLFCYMNLTQGTWVHAYCVHVMGMNYIFAVTHCMGIYL